MKYKIEVTMEVDCILAAAEFREAVEALAALYPWGEMLSSKGSLVKEDDSL